MAAPISDAVVVDVLRRVDRLTAPLVRRLGRPPARPQAERDAWWADQVSRVAAGLSPPRRASSASWPTCCPCRTPWGRRSSRSSSWAWPASTASRTRPSGCRCWPASCWAGTSPPSGVEPLLTHARAPTGRTRSARRRAAGRCAPLWRAARLLSRIDDALDARPKGRLHHRALANLPVVGVFGGYAAEREGLRACREQRRPPLLRRPPGHGSSRPARARLAYTSRVAVDRFMVMKWMPGTPSSSSVRHSSVATSTPIGPDGGLVLGAVAVELGEPVGEVGRERLTGQLHDPVDLLRVGHGHDPGDDRHVAGPLRRRGRAAAGSPRRGRTSG